jgi:hypothetical protein
MTSPNEATEAPSIGDETADAARLSLVALRDVALVLAALSLWAGADAAHALTGSLLAAILASGDGLLVGAALGALAHEWGHFAGARLSGGTAPLAPARGFLPLFNFDFQRSDPGHFQAMSVGGNLAHWSVVLAIAVGLAIDAPGRVALLSGSFGFAVFASLTEFPVIWKNHQGLAPLEALRGIRGDLLVRNGMLGAGSAALLGVALA